MSQNERIDFEKEAMKLHSDLRLQGFEHDKLFILDAMNSLAQRIEEQTIQRCNDQSFFTPKKIRANVRRLYASDEGTRPEGKK